MKNILLTLVVMTAFTATANAKCDAHMKTVFSCDSTPKKGDNQIVGQIADKIQICTLGKKTFIALEAEGEGPAPEQTIPSVRAGATVYPITGADAYFSIGTRPYPNKVKYAKLYMTFGEDTYSSTFTCKY